MSVGQKIMCLKCKDIIQSMHVHNMVDCKCGAISIDGGGEYCKISGELENVFFIESNMAFLERTQGAEEIFFSESICLKVIKEYGFKIDGMVIYTPLEKKKKLLKEQKKCLRF